MYPLLAGYGERYLELENFFSRLAQSNPVEHRLLHILLRLGPGLAALCFFPLSPRIIWLPLLMIAYTVAMYPVSLLLSFVTGCYFNPC